MRGQKRATAEDARECSGPEGTRDPVLLQRGEGQGEGGREPEC